MPFKSVKQRKWMYANDPEMAARWEKHTPKGKKLPKYAPKKKKKSNYLALITKFANIEEAIAKGLREKHPDWTMEQICDEIDRMGEQFAKRNASVVKLSSREYQHCLVCGSPSNKVASSGSASRYECSKCHYKFMNR